METQRAERKDGPEGRPKTAKASASNGPRFLPTNTRKLLAEEWLVGCLEQRKNEEAARYFRVVPSDAEKLL